MPALASGSFDKTIKIWKLDEDRLVATLKGHSPIFSLKAKKIRSKECLISESGDKTIEIWKLESRKELKELVASSTIGSLGVFYDKDNKLNSY